ncbi:S-adenosyl-L-methionine-dependent methyltransferase [Truncatella angustata]|uniref:peptide chain release factor N(5)-glutamine methyltransferase n=1 Tax=Truncatella angustata TaxID=152316 RepID=A0A9P8UHC4_9PEZI|nr:S-adenosyl-L-methionine-dependent methyltransferase [Truncatella angustata]KAH6652163.1 S-adenosyl-L-methionine-dependent methyltransferase [Truncatella angustata]
MPRLPPSLLYRAHRISPHLKTLLPACRDLESAQNELRWIREHAASSASSRPSSSSATTSAEATTARLVAQRGRGAPLQYVLGSQPFGSLDLKCGRGVLIPRPETEAYVYHLAERLRSGALPGVRPGRGDLRILDLCTGTGCIALLLHERLRGKFPEVRAAGLDVSAAAVRLARENLRRNVEGGVLPEGAGVVFGRADIFADDWRRHVPGGAVDVLVSNPPYISAEGFDGGTGRSVRNFEPKLALVPGEGLRAAAESLRCELADVFYARLFEIAGELEPRVMLFEVGDMEQAMRVVRMATRIGSGDELGCEIWRDEPATGESETCLLDPQGPELTIRGEGHGRSVVVYRKLGGG